MLVYQELFFTIIRVILIAFGVAYIMELLRRKMVKPKHDNKCGASWQTITISGVMYQTKCRICGVYVTEGGTPKCKRNEK